MWRRKKYPKDPTILTYVKKRLTFFRLLSRLNKIDLCGLFFLLNVDLTYTVILLKKTHTCPACLGVRAFWKKWVVFFDKYQYLWVVRVVIVREIQFSITWILQLKYVYLFTEPVLISVSLPSSSFSALLNNSISRTVRFFALGGKDETRDKKKGINSLTSLVLRPLG